MGGAASEVESCLNLERAPASQLNRYNVKPALRGKGSLPLLFFVLMCTRFLPSRPRWFPSSLAPRVSSLGMQAWKQGTNEISFRQQEAVRSAELQRETTS